MSLINNISKTKIIIFLIIVIAVLFAISLLPGNETTPVKTNNTGGTEQPAIGADEEMIKQALVAKHGEFFQGMVVTVSENDGQYATGTAGSDDPMGGGGHWFAKKVGGSWEIVWDGNGFVMCEDLIDYPDFPATLIPECYNSVTDTTTKR